MLKFFNELTYERMGYTETNKPLIRYWRTFTTGFSQTRNNLWLHEFWYQHINMRPIFFPTLYSFLQCVDIINGAILPNMWDQVGAATVKKTPPIEPFLFQQNISALTRLGDKNLFGVHIHVISSDITHMSNSAESHSLLWSVLIRTCIQIINVLYYTYGFIGL